MLQLLILLFGLAFAFFSLSNALYCHKAVDLIGPAGLLVIGLFLVAVAAGGDIAISKQITAVDAGHAEYYIDSETHKREWRWLRSCAPVPETMKINLTLPPYPDSSKESKP